MAAVRMRTTRRLRAWIVEQVNSGKYPGLVWDDDARTMFRIPWKHAGKQDFRKEEDAAIFKAWAEFKGKTSEDSNNPAVWKTRLRCALNKSPEFSEVVERAQLDISEPYKVYRLVPLDQQGVVMPQKKLRERVVRRSKRRSSSVDLEVENAEVKKIKTEEASEQAEEELLLQSEEPVQMEETVLLQVPEPREPNDELRLDMKIKETVPSISKDEESFHVLVHYLGTEVLSRRVDCSSIRISYLSSSPTPPTPTPLSARFPCVALPEPPPSLASCTDLKALRGLLGFMEKGVLLTSQPRGIYGRRSCRGRVFWSGPHATQQGPHKMERQAEPVLLFDKQAFKQQLETFLQEGRGEPPQCSFTLCFGEELNSTDNPSTKFIIVHITLPWAEQQVQSAQALMNPIVFLQSLASQSPLGEITLNLVAVPMPDALP